MARITFTNVHRYSQAAFDAVADNTVFYDLYISSYELFNEHGNDFLDKRGINPSVLINNYQTAYEHARIFSALAVEAYLNLLASYCVEKQVWTKIERKPIGKKLRTVAKALSGNDKEFDDSPIFKEVRDLFDERDNLVHDKGKEISTGEEYKTEYDLRAPKMSSVTAFDTALHVEDFLFSVESKKGTIRDRICPGALRGFWEEWCDLECRYDVEYPLPYAGAQFPNLVQYLYFTRRHLGRCPLNVEIDERKRIIQEE